jgi:hypothetical protein
LPTLGVAEECSAAAGRSREPSALLLGCATGTTGGQGKEIVSESRMRLYVDIVVDVVMTVQMPIFARLPPNGYKLVCNVPNDCLLGHILLLKSDMLIHLAHAVLHSLRTPAVWLVASIARVTFLLSSLAFPRTSAPATRRSLISA